MSFVHLHTHSEFSLLDGANRITDLTRRAAEFEMPALALTDHGCLFGAWTFQKEARKAGIKPILGMEAYVSPGSRHDRSRSGHSERAYYHLLLLARDLEGWQNLVKLSSRGYTEGFYHKPRVDRELLAAHSAGLVVSSACMAGEVARHLEVDNLEGAREAASWYAEVFKDRYYLEVQGHDSPGQAALNSKIFALGDDLGLPIIATNDAHFLRAEDHAAHDVLLCIGLAKDHSDPDRMRYDRGLYFKNPVEMAERFPDRPDVLENTLKIADEVQVEFDKSYHLPRFPLPESYSNPNDYLVHLTKKGAEERYGSPLPEPVQERLDYELGVILETGYAGYFLIVWDCIAWARENGIPVGPGRGSAAGSIVSYCLGITGIDPLEFDLVFERFLNPERISMPDIDIDFCYERRGDVIEHVRDKYGRDAVGQIITFGTMKSRAVIRDVGRTLGFEPGETDRIAKLIPNQPGQSFTVEEAVKKIAEVQALYKQDQRHKELFDHAMTLEGLSRHASVHAAGVVIAPGPLEDYVPVCLQSKSSRSSSDSNGSAKNGTPDVVTQFDMNCLEEAGMLKMDFLGLKTLTVIDDAAKEVQRRKGALTHPTTGTTYASIDDVPLDDPSVYAMLASGGTQGVFQFESSLATDKLRQMRCDRFEDLIATNALIRPGPLDSGMTDVYIRRKLGQEEVRYEHPALEKVLEATYGVIVYQEQVMRIPAELAGYTLGEADVLRKAVGKKIQELIDKELEHFRTRCEARGVDARTAKSLASQIETFGRYGFNRAHSVAYSLLSYQTAWLKVHYPAEYMAALLSSVLDRTDDVVRFINECRGLHRSVASIDKGLEVLPPDVNESRWKFAVTTEGAIRFGLGAVKGVGSGAVQSIINAREEGGPFTSLFDFLERIELRALNKRAAEALITAGAMDGFGHRAQLVAGLDAAYSEAQARQAEDAAGQASLFGGDTQVARPQPNLPVLPKWKEGDRLAREKEALGFYISGHPLDRFRNLVEAFDAVNSGNLASHSGQTVELAGVVTQVARQISRRDNSEWGKITIEDFHGTATVLAFRDAWQEAKDLLEQDAVVLISGKISSRERDEEDPPIFLDAAESLDGLRKGNRLAIQILLDPGSELNGELFRGMKEVLEAHSGPAAVEIQVGTSNGRPAPVFRSRSLRADPSRDTVEALASVVGASRVKIVRTVKAPTDQPAPIYA